MSAAKRETPTSHTMRALTEIRERILDGEFPGGMRLFEVAMAETLDISRTPVREAMSRLVEEGLLERAKGGGFLVRAFGVKDVFDAIELRGVLEGTAARLAAERDVPAAEIERFASTVAALDTCFGDTAADVDFNSYARLNADFHAQLTELSGSKVLAREIEHVTKLPFASPSAFLPDKVEAKRSWRSLLLAQAQHREILSAIERGESSRAEYLTREHARTARRDLEQVLTERRGRVGNVAGLPFVTGVSSASV